MSRYKPSPNDVGVFRPASKDDATTQLAPQAASIGMVSLKQKNLETDDGSRQREPLPGDGNGVESSTGRLATPPIHLADQQATVISRQPPENEFAFATSMNAARLGKTLEGRMLGHFELVEFVGGGGMGAVFRATDTMLGRTVAVKVLSQEHGQDAETVQRFKNEAQSAARLDHENIARVYYVGQDEGWNFIVFEFIEGTNLRDMVAQHGPLSLAAAMNYIVQVAEALQHAARRDVVHRDIKPSNILITPDGRAKLVDMGLARLHQAEAAGADLTASGVTLGTFDYISPEQARDPRLADVRSDLYSLGCSFFFMLTGRPPFPEGTVLQKLLSHTSDAPPELRQFRPDVPDEVALILDRMLAKQPDDRYQEPSELIGELLLLSQRLGLAVSKHGTVWISDGTSHRSVWERHIPWMVPVAILVAIVVLINLFSAGAGPDYLPPPRFQLPGDTAGQASSLPSGEQFGRLPGEYSDAERRADQLMKIFNSSNEFAPSDGSQIGLPSNNPGSSEYVGGGPASTASSAPGETIAGNGHSATDNHAPAASETTGSSDTATTTSNSVLPAGVASSQGTEATTGQPPAHVGSIVYVGKIGDPSLAEAFALAANHSSVEAIELRYNGFRRTRPIVVGDVSLIVRPAPGFSPTVTFSPEAASDDFRGMRLLAGEITFQDIGFLVELPTAIADAGRVALFEVSNMEMLRLVSCVVTVKPSEDGGKQVVSSVFHVLDRQETENAFAGDTPPLLDGADPGTLQGPVPWRLQGPQAIDLWHCVIRGDTDLIRLHRPTPMRLSWSNGLFSSSRRLLVSEGGSTSDEANQVTLDLEHVTCFAQQGLMLYASKSTSSIPPRVALRLFDSVFACQELAPFVEHRSELPAEALVGYLNVAGRGNFYLQSDVFWRRRSSKAVGELVEWDFAAWQSHWKDELVPQRTVRFAEPFPPPTAFYLQTPRQFLLSDHPGNPAYRSSLDRNNAGMRADRLPRVDDESAIAAGAASSVEPSEPGGPPVP